MKLILQKNAKFSSADVMSIHYVSRLLQFFLSGSAFVSLAHEYW